MSHGIWRQLRDFLKSGKQAEALRIGQLSIGDDASSLNTLADLTTELPTDAEVDEVLAGSGRLVGGGIAFDVLDSRIESFIFRDCDELDLRSEQAISELLGPPDHRVLHRYGLELTYATRRITLICDTAPFRIQVITLGTNVPSCGKGEFAFAGGVRARLAEISLRHTYEGLLEGVPTRRMNKSIVDAAVKRARSVYQLPVVLCEPEQTPIRSRHLQSYPFGRPASLPITEASARFRSSALTSRAMDGSELAVVWFQQAFDVPPDNNLFLTVDWLSHARDFEW